MHRRNQIYSSPRSSARPTQLKDAYTQPDLTGTKQAERTEGGTHRQAFDAAAAVVVAVVPHHRRVTSADPAGAAARGPRRVHRAVEPLSRVDSPAIRRRNPGILLLFLVKEVPFSVAADCSWRGWMRRGRARRQNELSRVFREL